MQKLSTGDRWTCGGVAPVKLGANGVAPWGKFPTIDADAQWIWNSDKQVAGDRTSCKVVLPYSTEIAVTVDNTIEEIQINSRKIPLNYGGENHWPLAKVYPEALKAGDIVEIFGSNAGGPAGILATIRFLDIDGNLKTISTGNRWVCAGNVPIKLGVNGVAPWGKFGPIEDDAQWIWNTNKQAAGDRTSCKVVLPFSTEIAVTVDNTIEEILVNSKKIPLNYGGENQWPLTKVYPTELKSGDVIEISGSNAGGPAGVLASLRFLDLSGKLRSFSTGRQWTCGSKPAVTQGDNGVLPWGKLPSIDSDAQWLWSSKEQITGDKTSCKTTLPVYGISVTVDNIVTGIQVNGKNIKLDYGKEDHFPTTKFYAVDLKEKDTVEIFGKNTGGPAGILATVEFTDSEGNALKVSTNGEWSCGGKPAVILGKNGAATWGAFPSIAADANWIWNSAKETAGDTTSCKIELSGKERPVRWSAELSWGKKVKDLDLVVLLPDKTKVYYNSQVSKDGRVQIDRDYRNETGKETVSFSEKITGGVYQVWVYDFSADYEGGVAIAQSEAKVVVKRNGVEVKNFDVPKDKGTGVEVWWHVFDINFETGSLVESNSVWFSLGN